MARCSASSSARRRRASRALGVCRSPSTSSASSCGCSPPSTGTSLACTEPARSASPGQPVGRARPPDRSLRRVRLPARHVPAMRFPDPPLRPAARRLLRRGARLARDWREIGPSLGGDSAVCYAEVVRGSPWSTRTRPAIGREIRATGPSSPCCIRRPAHLCAWPGAPPLLLGRLRAPARGAVCLWREGGRAGGGRRRAVRRAARV